MIVVLFFGLLNMTFASSLDVKCGNYEFQGIPKFNDDRIFLLIHEGTSSEILIHVRPGEIPALAPYLNLPTKGEVSINTIMGPREIGSKFFEKLDYGIPDPLNPLKNSYLRLIKEEKCL